MKLTIDSIVSVFLDFLLLVFLYFNVMMTSTTIVITIIIAITLLLKATSLERPVAVLKKYNYSSCAQNE